MYMYDHSLHYSFPLLLIGTRVQPKSTTIYYMNSTVDICTRSASEEKNQSSNIFCLSESAQWDLL